MKGISPLIASILLVVIVLSIASLIANWMTNFTKTTQDTFTNQSDATVQCSGAQIDIREVYLTNGTLASGNIIIENVGFVDNLHVISVQVYNKTGSNFTANGIPITGFNRGNVVTIPFANASIQKCADFDRVVATTNCAGTTDVYRFNPIGC